MRSHSMLEFCNGNRHHGTGSLIEELEQRDDCDAIEYGCLGNCGECFAKPFAMIDGIIVATDSIVELREKALAHLAGVDDADADPFADLPYLDD